MLVEFRFKTEPLFPEEQVLSLVASKEKRIEENVFDTGIKNIPRLLRSAVIYGANGHGKSTILNLLVDFIKWICGAQDYFPRYLGSAAYEIIFIMKGVAYTYRLEIDGHTIVSEELQHYKGGKRVSIFKRTVDKKTDRSEIKIGKGFPEYKYLTKTKIPENELLFHCLPKSFITTWLHENVIGIQSKEDFDGCLGFDRDVGIYEKIKAFLNDIDCGITDFKVDVDKKEVEFYFPNNPPVWNWVPTDRLPSGIEWLVRRLYGIFHALKHGKLLVLDDLGNGLHPLLVGYIVELFHNPETNPKNAQLIFTTHCTHLLETKTFLPRLVEGVFRRDQVWFVEYRYSEKKSKLYPLSDFKEGKRDYKHQEIKYLLGCYGATPFLM